LIVMTKSKVFLILSLSFIGGVAGASFYYPKIIDSAYLLIFLLSAIIILAVNYRNKSIAVLGFAILFFISGIYLTSAKLEKIKNLDQNGQKISGVFVISKEPEISGRMQRIIFGHPMSKSKILAAVSAYPEYKYGDEIKLSCDLKIPENKTFDWQMYLAKDGIFYECKNIKIENLPVGGLKNRGNIIYAGILKIKNKLNKNIEKLIPAPESGLLSGLILGGDDKLSKKIQNNFSKTGMTHIVAVSGYNVTIVAEYLMILGIFIGLWRKQAFWFAVVGIILFIAMTGFPSSAVRAGVMGILLIWAVKNGRLANSQNAILFAAAVMLLVNPLLLRWDIGFQLSFLATLGIVYMYPIFNDYFFRGRDKSRLVPTNTLLEILFLTLSAQIFVLPVILFNFQKLSLISPLANLLVLPIIPLTMMLGFLGVALSFIFYPLGQFFSWLAYLPLEYETAVINYLAGLKYSSIEMHLSWWGVVVWYIVLVVVVFLLRRQFKKG
jgi:competence protein ComEC